MNANPAYAFAQSVSLEAPGPAAGKGAEIFSLFSSAYARERREAMSVTDFLEGCRDNPGMTASAAERMIAAIGEPEIVDTSKDPRLGRIFMNRTIKRLSGVRRTSTAWKRRSSGSSASSARRAGPGGAQADPLPAGPGRRRQILAGRAAEDADGDSSRSMC